MKTASLCIFFSSPPFHKNGYSRYSVETYWNRTLRSFYRGAAQASPTTISFSPRLFAAAGRSVSGRSVVGRLVESPRLRWFRRHSGKVSECQGPQKIAARWCRNTLSLEGLVWYSMKWAPQWTLLLFTTCALRQQALEISQSWNCLIQTWKFPKSRNVELSVFFLLFFWLMPPNRGLSKVFFFIIILFFF